MTDQTLSPLDAANLLAGQAVAVATVYLDGRSDAVRLAEEIGAIAASVYGPRADDPVAAPLIKLVRILISVCQGIVDASAEADDDKGAALNMRDLWQDIARDVIRAIRYKSWMLCGGDTPPPQVDLIDDGTRLAALLAKEEQQRLRAELAQLEAAQADAPEWGAAVGARGERINAIRRQLAGDEPRG
jgi:hypothetical protein